MKHKKFIKELVDYISDLESEAGASNPKFIDVLNSMSEKKGNPVPSLDTMIEYEKLLDERNKVGHVWCLFQWLVHQLGMNPGMWHEVHADVKTVQKYSNSIKARIIELLDAEHLNSPLMERLDKFLKNQDQNGVETDKEEPNLLKIYEDFRDSDIMEGVDDTNILAFLYYLAKSNLDGKSFNPYYHANTEKDVINARIRDLEKLYKVTIHKNNYNN